MNAIEEAITQHILTNPDVSGAVVTTYVVVASYVDQDGDRHAYGMGNKDAHPHEVIGLLSYALTLEQDACLPRCPLMEGA